MAELTRINLGRQLARSRRRFVPSGHRIESWFQGYRRDHQRPAGGESPCRNYGRSLRFQGFHEGKMIRGVNLGIDGPKSKI